MTNYNEFLQGKKTRTESTGFDATGFNSQLFGFQRDIVGWAVRKGKAAVFAGTGLGKCMGFDTPILMHDGTTKPVQDVIVGDLLMGPDSKSRVVKSTTVGHGALFQVTPIKGNPFVCNDVHVMSLKCTADHARKYRKNMVVNMPLDEYLHESNKFKHMMKLWRTGTDFEKAPVDIDPYFIGMWLGDGSYGRPIITKTEKDAELCEYFRKFASRYDTGLAPHPDPKHNTTKWCFTKGPNGGNETWILSRIRELCINNEKRIPAKYLINDSDSRLDLLAGLIDSDGHLADNMYEIVTKYEGLSEDILFLARSLGLAAYCTRTTKTIKSLGFGGEYYRILISGDTHIIPVKLERKQATVRKQKKDVLKTGFSAEPVGMGDYYGFELDGDGLYLLGDFTVTHNTFMQIEWARLIHEHEDKPVMILTPLAVASQTAREGAKFGIDITLCRSQEDVTDGVNITNYDMLHKFDPAQFCGVVLDESSILKSFTGKVRNQIIESFIDTPYKLACTATPAPNDHMELGNHAEFLGVMTRAEMLSMYFVHDGGNTSQWRLKGHSVGAFWDWVSSWAVMLTNPSDLGYENNGFDLPPLEVNPVVVDKTGYRVKEAQTLTERRDARRNSLDARVAAATDLVNNSDDTWIIWCDMNVESEAITKAIDGAVEIRGSHDREYKTEKMTDFANGDIRVLVSKPPICGFGMNFQVCHNMAFVGLSDSFEAYYQAVRRCWRFGQTETTNVHVITSEAEGAVVKNINRKEDDFKAMQQGMISATQELSRQNLSETKEEVSEYMAEEAEGNNWTMYLDDNVVRTKVMESNSIDFTMYSPPFSSLYTYSDSDRDMGNCKTDEEFFEHFGFLAPELFRTLKPGRLMSVHCMNLPTTITKDSYIGIKDFRGDIIRLMQSVGFIYHSEVCIWKDPAVDVQRTKALGLLHKQLKKDSCRSRMSLPDYVLTFQKPGGNPEPVTHTDEQFHCNTWQKYASPVWFDIRQSNTLQRTSARDEKDERHICPLQFDVIQRCVELWTNPDDLVYDPFAGIGSTLYQAVLMGRRGVGCELKQSYFTQAVKNMVVADRKASAPKQVGFDYFDGDIDA